VATPIPRPGQLVTHKHSGPSRSLGRLGWNGLDPYAELRSDQAAIVACACSLHGPRSPSGGDADLVPDLDAQHGRGFALRVGVAESTKRRVCWRRLPHSMEQTGAVVGGPMVRGSARR